MTVNEIAAMLGEELAKTEEYKKFIKSKADYEADEELESLIEAYNMEKLRLDIIEKQGNDSEKAEACTDSLNKLYQQIFARPAMTNYAEANEKLTDLLDSVNKVIVDTMNGDSGCTPDKCAHCGLCH